MEWQKGKQIYPDCRFLVNLDSHHNRCQTTVQRVPLADITPSQADLEPTRETENPQPDTTVPTNTTL